MWNTNLLLPWRMQNRLCITTTPKKVENGENRHHKTKQHLLCDTNMHQQPLDTISKRTLHTYHCCTHCRSSSDALSISFSGFPLLLSLRTVNIFGEIRTEQAQNPPGPPKKRHRSSFKCKRGRTGGRVGFVRRVTRHYLWSASGQRGRSDWNDCFMPRFTKLSSWSLDGV